MTIGPGIALPSGLWQGFLSIPTICRALLRRRKISIALAAALLPFHQPADAGLPDATGRLCPAGISAIDAFAVKALSDGSPGVAIAISENGRIVFSGSYGIANLEDDVSVTPQTVFKIASITKQFTAAAILLLVEDGKLRFEDRLDRYVPELPQSGQITLYQLLIQTSGLPDYASYPDILQTKSVKRSTSQMIDLIGTLKPELLFTPGTRWSYSNSNYVLLGRVIEKVSGQSLDAFFEERLFKPAHLAHASFDDPAAVIAHRAQGYRKANTASGYKHADWLSPTMPGAAGALQATAEDLLKWSDALFSGRIISHSSLEKMIAAGLLSDGRSSRFAMPPVHQTHQNADYGMGVNIASSKLGKRVWHNGSFDGFRSLLTVYPEAKLAVAILENGETSDPDIDSIETAVADGSKCHR